MSKYLYFNLVSSNAVVLLVISKGKSIAGFNTFNLFTSTSISPVFKFGFLLLLSLIIPFTSITYSLFKDDAIS